MNCVVVLARVKCGGPVEEGNGVPPADHLWRETARRQLETAVAEIAKRLSWSLA